MTLVCELEDAICSHATERLCWAYQENTSQGLTEWRIGSMAETCKLNSVSRMKKLNVYSPF